MAVKVTKGQLSNGTISKITYHGEYYLCGKFHGFMKKCTILPILGAMPLYYIALFAVVYSSGIVTCISFSTKDALIEQSGVLV